jgi:hypothetical protein
MTEPIQKWEYRVETFGNIFSGPKDEALMETLDAWGEDGWEVVNVFSRTNSERITVVAKRPLTLDERRRRSIP